MNSINGQEFYGIRLDVDSLKRDVAQIKGQFHSIGKSVEVEGAKMNGMFGKIGAGIVGAFSVSQLVAFTHEVAKVRGEFQQLEIAFETMLGSKEKSDKLMSELIRTAAITPFSMSDVTKGAKQLLAYGIEAENVNHILTKLGDIAAGLSIPLGDLTYLYGTTMVQGRMFTQDLRQFMGRGIPIADELAKQFGVAKSEVDELVSKGKVGADEFKKAIMSIADGKFANLMEKQSKSITGQIENLKDAIEVELNEIGKKSEKSISKVIQSGTWLIENYERIGKEILGLVTIYGTYKAVIIALNAVEANRRKILVIINQMARVQMALNKSITKSEAVRIVQSKMLTQALWAQTKAQVKANLAVMANPYVIAAASVAALTYGIYKLVTAETSLEKATKLLNSEKERQTELLNENKSKAEELLRTAQNLEETDTQRRVALNELQKLYPDLFSNLDLESVKYVNLAEKIRLVVQELERKAELESGQKLLKGQKLLNRLESGWRMTIKDRQEAMKIMGKDEEPWLSMLGLNIGKKGGRYAVGEFDLNEFRLYIDGLKKQKLEREKINEQIEFDNQSSEKKIDFYKKQNKELEKQKNIIESRTSSTRDGYEYDQSQLDIINTKIRQNEARIKKIKESDKPQKTTIKTTSKGGVIKDYSDQLDREIQQLERQLIDLEQQATQSKIDAMQDGLAKVLEQNKLNYEIEKEQLKRQAEDRLKTIQENEKSIWESKGGKGKFTPKTTSLSDEEQSVFDKQQNDIIKKYRSENAKAKIQAELEFMNIHNQVTSVISNSEKARHNEIKRNYAELRKEIEKLYKGGSITEEQYKGILPVIDTAEQKEQLQQILSGVYDYQSQLDEINETWNAKLQADAKLNGGKLAEAIKKGHQEAISELQVQELMKSDEWINLFGNLEKLSVSSLEKLRDAIKDKVKGMDLDPINLKIVKDSLDNADKQIATKNPFKGLKNAINEYKSATDEVEKNNSFYDIFSNASEIADIASQSFGAVVGGIKELGIEIDSETEKMLQGINGIIDGASQLAQGLASENPGAIIAGGIKLITSAIQVFDSKTRKANRTIQANERELERLDTAYRNLQDSVDEFYASDKAQHIEQMKNMKEKQKELIRANIEAEKSKKKPNQDRINEYEQKLNNINNEIKGLEKQASEAIMGSSVSQAIDNFADAYVSAWKAGEDKAKSMKDVVRSMVTSAVKELTSKKLKTAVTNLYNVLSNALLDGEISNYEAKLIEQAELLLDKEAEKLDKQLKKSGLDKYRDSKIQGAASYGEYEKITQDQASAIDGRLTGMHMIMIDSNVQLKGINENTSHIPTIRTDVFEMKNYLLDMWGEAVQIRKNTHLLNDTNDKLDKLIKNTDNL